MFILVPLRDVVMATAKVRLPVFTEATVIYTKVQGSYNTGMLDLMCLCYIVMTHATSISQNVKIWAI